MRRASLTSECVDTVFLAACHVGGWPRMMADCVCAVTRVCSWLLLCGVGLPGCAPGGTL